MSSTNPILFVGQAGSLRRVGNPPKNRIAHSDSQILYTAFTRSIHCRSTIEFGTRMEKVEPRLFDSAQEYWDCAAGSYDKNFTRTLIGRTRRLAVWREL